MTEPVASLNGSLVPQSEASVPVTDLGVVAGASVTEMIRTFGHKPFRVADHLDRLCESIELMRFPYTPSRQQIEAAIEAVAQNNTSLIPEHHDLGVVVFVTAGQNLTYLGGNAPDQVSKGTLCVHSFPLPFELWADRQVSGQHLATVSVLPLPVQSVSPVAKHRNRMHWLRADREARERYRDANAVLVTPDGSVTETSSGNIFVVHGRTIRTPPSELVLGGISRKVLSELAETAGFSWEEATVSVESIRTADEVLTTSTPYCVMPVTRFDNCVVGNGEPGPVFQQLMTAWSNLVGLDIVRQTVDGARERSAG